MDKKEKLKEPVVTSSTTYDDRRKVLVHKAKEIKETDLGELISTTEASIHEKGIKETYKNLNQQKKTLKENIVILRKNLGEKPKMTAELEALKANLVKLQLIDHIENVTESKKEQEKKQLEDSIKDLAKVEKDLNEIKEAVGNRLKL